MKQDWKRIRLASIVLIGAITMTVLLTVMLPSFATSATSSTILSSESGSGNLDSYIQVLRSDLRTQKSEIITENMNFSEKESTAFWPIYRKYEAELMKLNGEKIELIKDYAKSFSSMTDAKAKELTEKALGLEGKRTGLKKKFFKEFSKVLSPKTVLKFFQVDNRIELIVNVQIAAELPMVEK
jgi:hypothetical protein